ncbi:MAG: ribosome-associated translation inhibitor RaiA [Cyclobacteriaceae bacterium]|jgi:ribosome-associated translation inhibitor RaiA
MKIQYNTDKTINGDERHQNHFTSLIAEALKRFQSHITRIEVHLSDENGKKEGKEDIRCLLEARIEGRQPLVVSCQANTVVLAISGALDKLKASLETILGRIQNH